MEEILKSFIETNLKNMDLFTDEIYSQLSTNLWTASNVYYKTAMDIRGIIEPIALTIVGICFLIEFLKITINMDVLKYEYMLKCFFKLVFAKVCINISFDLMAAIYATAIEWVTGIKDPSNFQMGAVIWDNIKGDIGNYGMLQLVAIMISSGIMLIAAELCCLMVLVTVYATLFELTVYMAISPLPCAFLPLEDSGASRIPKKFFFNYAGICLHLVFIAICLNLYVNLCDSIILTNQLMTWEVFIAFPKVLLVTLVFMMAVTKSGSWAQRIFDAA
ncbi:MAG: hypothetical protein K2H41_15430 [Acetatifactor sp.]|nr:hypothetical protein [Acetatifactor sp.]